MYWLPVLGQSKQDLTLSASLTLFWTTIARLSVTVHPSTKNAGSGMFQVTHLLDVYETKGGAFLETYKAPPLAWEEVQALLGPGTVGLGVGRLPGRVSG